MKKRFTIPFIYEQAKKDFADYEGEIPQVNTHIKMLFARY
jgi:hypothetical protein